MNIVPIICKEWLVYSNDVLSYNIILYYYYLLLLLLIVVVVYCCTYESLNISFSWFRNFLFFFLWNAIYWSIYNYKKPFPLIKSPNFFYPKKNYQESLEVIRQLWSFFIDNIEDLVFTPVSWLQVFLSF